MLASLRYIVASTPRTGSNLLCECLEATGVAGRPVEAFAPDFKWIWYRRWSLPENASFGDYLRAAIRHGTVNDVFGLKIQWMHVRGLARDAQLPDDSVLDSLFACDMFINIVRRDRRAQAISWYRAIESNEWYRIRGTDQPTGNGLKPVFNPTAIRALEQHLEWQQCAWARYFKKRRIEPFVIEYESLAGDYQTQVARALAFLGLNPQAGFTIPPPRLIRQADDLSVVWQRIMEATCISERSICEITA